MVEAILISKPQIDLTAAYRYAAQGTGLPITKAIDEATVSLSDDAKFLSALSAFTYDSPSSAIDKLRNADFEFNFLHYVFFMYSDRDTLHDVYERTRLRVMRADAIDGGFVFFAAGTLMEWRCATRICCAAKASFNLRLLFDKVVLTFEKLGLGEIWFDSRKRTLNDHTFLLEDKR